MFVKLAQISQENTELKAEKAELEAKVAHLEKLAEAEKFLTEIQDSDAPMSIRPTTIEDFLEKRAALAEGDNLKSAELAVKIASRQDFQIGEVSEQTRPEHQTGEGKADAIMSEWLGQYL